MLLTSYSLLNMIKCFFSFKVSFHLSCFVTSPYWLYLPLWNSWWLILPYIVSFLGFHVQSFSLGRLHMTRDLLYKKYQVFLRVLFVVVCVCLLFIFVLACAEFFPSFSHKRYSDFLLDINHFDTSNPVDHQFHLTPPTVSKGTAHD